MSIKDNFPSVGPSLSLNFARSKTLDPRITFSRSSSSGDATYTDANGLIVTAAADEPRFDHKIENGVVKSLGLLVEEQRTNLIAYSTYHAPDGSNSDFRWQPLNGASTSSTTETAPDGTSTAWRWDGNSGTGAIARIFLGPDTFTANGSDSYTVSFYAKLISGTTKSADMRFDLQDTQLLTNYESNLVTGEWKRIVITGTPASGTYTFMDLVNNNTTDYVIDFWGVQVEAGAFPTSYIPTSGATKTRSPDNVTMTGTNFSDWYNQDEGTVYVSQKLKGVQDDSRNNLVYKINGGGGSDYFYNTKSGDKNIFIFGDDGTNYSRFQDNTDSTDTKTAFAYDVSGDDFKPYHDGIEVTNETISNTPSATSHTQLELGASSGAKYCGHIQQFAYYPKRLTNTQLQNLTK